MKTKLFVVVLLVLVLASSLVGAVGAQGPGPSAPPPMPLARRALARVGASQGQNVELVGQIGGAVNAVAVEGHIAYIGVGPRLVLLDISNPASPAILGQTGVLSGVVGGVAVAGRYAYVADEWSGLHIVDVSDPAHPREMGFYDTLGGLGRGGGGLLRLRRRWGRRAGHPAILPVLAAPAASAAPLAITEAGRGGHRPRPDPSRRYSGPAPNHSL